MDKNFSKELKREKYSFIILHQNIHFIAFQNLLKSKNTSLKSPIIKELMKDKKKLQPQSGEMFEFLLCVILFF